MYRTKMLAVVAAIAAFAVVGAASAQTKIKVGRTLSGSGFHVPIYIAFDKGFFKVTDKASQRISADYIRAAARDWYSHDKLKSLRNSQQSLLDRLIATVIARGNTRFFMMESRVSRDQRFQSLVDFRVVHPVRTDYREPGTVDNSYNIYALDYAAYGDFLRSKNRPQVRPTTGDRPGDDFVALFDDDRWIQRVVVDLEKDLEVHGR